MPDIRRPGRNPRQGVTAKAVKLRPQKQAKRPKPPGRKFTKKRR